MATYSVNGGKVKQAGTWGGKRKGAGRKHDLIQVGRKVKLTWHGGKFTMTLKVVSKTDKRIVFERENIRQRFTITV